MKNLKFLLLIALFFSIYGVFSQGVGINNDESSPDPSAILDVKSTTQGMLVPRMTAAQAFNISSPAEGLLVWGTDAQSFLYYKSGTWNYLTSEFAREIADFDFDTKITTGNGLDPDDDLIKIYCGKIDESFIIDSMRIAPQSNSIFIGRNAGGQLLEGNNIAIGDSSLYNNGIGANSSVDARYNTAVGTKSLFSNKTGFYNTANGYKAGYSNTSGSHNTAIGFGALYSDSTGSLNTAVGTYTLYKNTTGAFNTANGIHALYENTIAYYNTAIGSETLFKNTTGGRNTALGANSLRSNITGNYNAAVGFGSLLFNTSGYSNVGIGVLALGSNTDRSNLVAIGDSALYNNGVGASEPFHAVRNTALGSKALYSNTTGSQNTANGYMALYSNSYGFQNTATGAKALFMNSGTGNTANGFYSLNANNSGNYNTALGYQSLQLNETGSYNIAIGYKALYSNNSAGNVAIGSETSWQSTTAINNTVLGHQSAYTNQGSNNTAIGYQALFSNEYGSRNTALGIAAGSSNISGLYNTIIGAYANTNASGYSNSVAIGDAALITASSQIRLGDNGVTSIGGYVNWSNISDKRFKTNVSQDVPGLEFIQLLEPVTYNLNISAINDFLGVDYSEKAEVLAESGKENIKFSGFIAQDVETVARSVGYDFSGVDAPKNEKDTYGLRYAEFVVPLVKAVQEQQAMIEEMKAEIVALKQQLKK